MSKLVYEGHLSLSKICIAYFNNSLQRTQFTKQIYFYKLQYFLTNKPASYKKLQTNNLAHVHTNKIIFESVQLFL